MADVRWLCLINTIVRVSSYCYRDKRFIADRDIEKNQKKKNPLDCPPKEKQKKYL